MSKNLDDELAQAAGIDDEDGSEANNAASMAVPQPAQPTAAAAEARADAPRTGRGLVVMLLVMVVGIVSLFMFGFQEAGVWSMPLEDFLGKGEEVVNRQVRIEGELVPGTLVKRDKPCEYRFTIRDLKAHDKKLKIRFPQCVVPDTFRDVPEGGVLVTAEGKLSGDGDFEATHIMAKCTSKYDPETHLLEGSDGQAKNGAPGATEPAAVK